ncbi:polysaccharide deacetylase family protein [uncultured Pontibacter sp.]|uniref:polysaccharide deacetylase family protein n=1 Tax=uncultured Pontibacter sp. TaxID=453356 RepID=UPI0026382D91|nr:polysaccharide deacetylase family protein [uncultured Pontibacter sp.]
MTWSARNIFTWFVANLLIIGGFVRRAKKRAMKGEFILPVYFHNPTKKEFEGCVKWLKNNGFTFLSMADLNEIRQKNLPLPKGGVLLTLDDGWQSNESNVIEVANKYKVPVSIFVSSEPVEDGVYWWTYLETAAKYNKGLPPKSLLKKASNVERISILQNIKNEITLPREALTVDQVKKASESEYVTIGGHTHTHPILINCKDDELYAELSLSKEKLEAWTGKNIHYFAYPNGDYGIREINALSELDYKLAFTCEPKYLTKSILNSNFELPRFGLLEGASLAENICRMLGVWKPLMLKFMYPKRRLSVDPQTTTVSSRPKSEMMAL